VSGGRTVPRRALGKAYRFLRHSVVNDYLLYPIGVRRHRGLERSAPRSDTHCYTCFHRSPGQLSVLNGPVVGHLSPGAPPAELSVNVLACSNGAEAYTVASELRRRFPESVIRVVASDLHRQNIDIAVEGWYRPDTVDPRGETPDEFIAATFEAHGDGYRVRAEIREMVEFSVASITDPLEEIFEPADVVLVQNVLFHLPPDRQEGAFRRAASILKPRSALFVDGMSLDMKVRLTAELGLSPVSFLYRPVYAHARRHVPQPWFNYYYGAEPFWPFARDRVRRYSTVFLRGA
jgi:chemotaxis protein methyltransferase CheR